MLVTTKVVCLEEIWCHNDSTKNTLVVAKPANVYASESCHLSRKGRLQGHISGTCHRNPKCEPEKAVSTLQPLYEGGRETCVLVSATWDEGNSPSSLKAKIWLCRFQETHHVASTPIVVELR